jgi:hypothetical protein
VNVPPGYDVFGARNRREAAALRAENALLRHALLKHALVRGSDAPSPAVILCGCGCGVKIKDGRRRFAFGHRRKITSFALLKAS